MLRRPFTLFLGLLILGSMACISGLSGTPSQPAQAPVPAQNQQPAQPGGMTGPVQPGQPGQPEQPAQPASPVASGRPITSYTQAENATVKVIATGTQALLEVGGELISNLNWSGSGFIIDPSGIVVTNNHVATGAATLKVYIAGDINQEFPARVIAASECMDLAVLQIEGIGPFPYMEWYTEPVRVGMEVYAAGFPGVSDDWQFTLTKGIISRERDDGDANWASMPYVYLHDARIRGGNSGGPLLTPDGKVVAVNYAGDDVKDANYAIPAELARPVVEQLRQGQPYQWLGINGTALVLELDDGSLLTGIWVASVETGSPADRVGLKPADIILTIENIQVALRGTMKEYCDILASRTPTSPIKVQVLRWQTGEILEGTINSTPLQVVATLQGEESQVNNDEQANGQEQAAGGQGDYTLWTDISGAIAVAAPSSWTDTDGTYWDTEVGRAASLIVAPSVDAFNNLAGPGLWVTASRDFAKLVGYVQMLDFFKQNLYQLNCRRYEGRGDYEDQVYRGKFDLWSQCGPDGQMEGIFLVVRPKTGSDLPDFLMTIMVHVTPDTPDVETLLALVFETFDVVGPLP